MKLAIKLRTRLFLSISALITVALLGLHYLRAFAARG